MIEPSIILGFDVSKKRVGIGLIRHDNGSCLAAHVWHTDTPGNELTERTQHLNDFAASIKDQTVIAVFLEDTFLMRHTGMVDSIVALGNIEALAATQWPGRLIERIKPSTWRKTLGLAARGKDDPLFYARERFHEDTGTHLSDHLGVKSTRSKSSGEQDAADALCVAIAGRALLWRGGVA